MRTRVTAILVARHGGEWLDQTLAGLAAQTRRPDRVIAVVNGGRESIEQSLRTNPGIDGVVSTQSTVSFGGAVRQGVVAIPADQPPAPSEPQAAAGAGAAAGSDDQLSDWYWLLAEDSAPEPAALEEILATVQRAPSVAVAGPKLVSWDHPDRIIELGQSLTHRGERWLLRRQERDQQQYDHLQDVLGVGPVGMLVRADVWRQLDGFDPAYSVYDDGLDLSVRARLAGFRVVVAPTSRVRFAQLGVAGPRIERSRRVLRVAHREARTAQLHRRIAYAPAISAFFMWLGLPLVAIARVCWALIREQPGNMWAEFSSALRVFFRPGAITASRRRVRAANTAGWGAVRPLRVDPKSVRTARMIDREAILVSQGRLREDMHFISSGGLAVLLVSALAAVALTWWALTQTSLTGGALAPLNPIGELWQNTRTVGGVPADPFAWVLALLGTITFWNPSHGVVLMLVAAIPLASLGGWIWAAQLTKSVSGRALLALGWAFSPVLLGSLAAGRLPTLILAVVLPWLLLAATRARGSWSWAGTASLLAAIALACAPVLIPAGLVLLVVGIAGSPRGTARVLSIAIAPLALFAPKLFELLRGGHPLDLLLDPGIVDAYRPGTTWHLLLGFPEFGLEGWAGIFDGLGLGALPATALVGVLLLPIVLLAAIGLITGRMHFTLLHAVLGGAGLLTAVGASKLQLLSLGAEGVALWTGSGLALYWIAVLGLAAVGTTTLRRAAAPVVAVALVAALIAIAPLAVKLATASSGLAPGETQMPAIVQAAGTQDPALRTLVLSAAGEAAVRAEIVTGPGVRLDSLRSAAQSSTVTEQDEAIAALVGTLASTGDADRAQTALEEQGIGFVLLATDGDAVERSQLQSALDQQSALENAGQTSHGLLWRVSDTTEADTGAAAAASESNAGAGFAGIAGNAFSRLLWWAQVVVLGAMLLLALPTGEVVERPERRRRKSAVAAGGAVSGAAAGSASESEDAIAGAAVEADEVDETQPGRSDLSAEPDAGAGASGLDPESEPAPEPASVPGPDSGSDPGPESADAIYGPSDEGGATSDDGATENETEHAGGPAIDSSRPYDWLPEFLRPREQDVADAQAHDAPLADASGQQREPEQPQARIGEGGTGPDDGTSLGDEGGER